MRWGRHITGQHTKSHGWTETGNQTDDDAVVAYSQRPLQHLLAIPVAVVERINSIPTTPVISVRLPITLGTIIMKWFPDSVI